VFPRIRYHIMMIIKLASRLWRQFVVIRLSTAPGGFDHRQLE
jgi:hypothetical protein